MCMIMQNWINSLCYKIQIIFIQHHEIVCYICSSSISLRLYLHQWWWLCPVSWYQCPHHQLQQSQQATSSTLPHHHHHHHRLSPAPPPPAGAINRFSPGGLSVSVSVQPANQVLSRLLPFVCETTPGTGWSWNIRYYKTILISKLDFMRIHWN